MAGVVSFFVLWMAGSTILIVGQDATMFMLIKMLPFWAVLGPIAGWSSFLICAAMPLHPGDKSRSRNVLNFWIGSTFVGDVIITFIYQGGSYYDHPNRFVPGFSPTLGGIMGIVGICAFVILGIIAPFLALHFDHHE